MSSWLETRSNVTLANPSQREISPASLMETVHPCCNRNYNRSMNVVKRARAFNRLASREYVCASSPFNARRWHEAGAKKIPLGLPLAVRWRRTSSTARGRGRGADWPFNCPQASPVFCRSDPTDDVLLPEVGRTVLTRTHLRSRGFFRVRLSSATTSSSPTPAFATPESASPAVRQRSVRPLPCAQPALLIVVLHWNSWGRNCLLPPNSKAGRGRRELDPLPLDHSGPRLGG